MNKCTQLLIFNLYYFFIPSQVSYKYNFDMESILDSQTIGSIVFIALIVSEIVFSLKYKSELYEWKDFGASSIMSLF